MVFEDNDVGGGEHAEMIAAYFDLHGLSTSLIIERMNHVRTFQTNAFFLRLSVFLSFCFSLLEDGLEPSA